MANDISVDVVLNGDEALKTLKAIEQGITKFSRDATTEVKKVDNSFSVFKGTIGTLVAVNFADTIKNQLKEAFNAAKEFETGLIAVQKTTDLTDKELSDFSEEILTLTKTLPFASKELLSIAQAAGQLGVKGTDNLLNFTKTIAKLGTASDISGEEAATQLTRILTVTKEGVGNIDELASSIVALGNNFAATESEIVRVTNEVARASGQFGVTSGEAAALGATLRSFGVRAEEAGTAVGKTFRAIEAAITNGGSSLTQLTKITGLTADELKKQFGENAVGVLQKFLIGLDEVKKGGGNLAIELRKVGLEGETISKVIPTLSAQNGELARALGLVNGEFKNASALEKEFSKFATTTESKFALLGNAAERLRIKIGKGLTEAFAAVAPLASDVLDTLAGEGNQVFIRNAKSVDELNKRLEYYKNLLVQVKESPAFGLQVGEDVNSLTKKINELNVAIGNTRTGDNVAELQKLEDQLKRLDEQAKVPIELGFVPPEVGVGVLLPNTSDVEERKAQLVEQIKNLKQQIALESNKLAEQENEANAKSLENTATTEQNRANIIAEYRAAKKEQDLAEREAEKELKALEADEDIQFLIDNLGRENTEREIARIKQIEDEKKRNEELKKLRDKARAEEKAGIFEIRKFEDLTNREKIAAQKETLSAIAGLSQSSNSALFAIGKAASLSLAGINVAEGVTKALSAFPPPFNFAAAAAVGAAGAVQIAKIASAKPPQSAGSFETGGVVGGNSFTGDKLTANVNSDEMILNRRQIGNLFKAIDEGNIGGGGGVVVNIQGDFLSSDQSVDKLIDSINDALEFRNRKLRS